MTSRSLPNVTQVTSPVIVALDFDDISLAQTFVSKLSPRDCRLKVGKEMFTLFGPDWVRYLNDQGFDIFLDLKFHDIPNTVAKAVKAASTLGVWMVNVHASGGKDMINAAKEATINANRPPLLTAVTILTSMDERQFSEVYESSDIANKVLSLATLAQDAGADGVVCSAKEASMLRANLNSDFCLVTPGIRPEGSRSDDQKRVMSPAGAISAGVDYLVIGRPITKADEPAMVLEKINSALR
jgi:orotidine-5'-phosphate decarboxylase